MNYPAYSEYRDSGVQWLGEVPQHWEERRLKFIFPRLYSGVSVNSENTAADTDSIGVLKTSCVYGNKFTPTENKQVFDDEIERVACSVTADSLIVSRMNTPELVGNCGYVEQEHPNLFLPDRLWIARFSEYQAMHGKYAWYFCISDGITKLTGALATGTSGSMKNLSQETFLNIDAILPPITEQTAIADFLDRETGRIDTLVAKKRRLIALLKEKRTALISRTVTRGLPEDAAREFGLEPHTRFKDSGIEWLGEVPEGWKVIPLFRIAETIQTGPFGSQLHSSDYVEGGIPLINPAHISANKIVPDELSSVDETTAIRLSRHRLREGDIVMGRRGEIGRCAVIGTTETGWLCGTGSLVVRLRNSSAAYFATIISGAGFRSLLELNAVGTTMLNLNPSIVGRMLVPVSPIFEQTAIANYLDRETTKIDQLMEKVEAVIERLQEYRSALIAAAVTGKIMVHENHEKREHE